MSWITTSIGWRSRIASARAGESALSVRRSRSENSTSSAVATAGLSSITSTVGIVSVPGPGPGYTVRVAIAGGIVAARIAGPSTAIWPRIQSRPAPTGRNATGSRATSYFCMSQRLIA